MMFSGDEVYDDDVTSDPANVLGDEGEEPERIAERTTPSRRRRAKVPPPPHPRMKNRAMAVDLATGTAIDVREIGVEVEGVPGVFELREYRDGVDYCDAREERWVWSIGRDTLGRVFASTDARCIFLDNPNFTCIWLR